MKNTLLLFAVCLTTNFAYAQNEFSNSNKFLKNNIKVIPYNNYKISDLGYTDEGFGLAFDRIISKSGKIGITSTIISHYKRSKNTDPDAISPSFLNITSGVKLYPWGQRRITIGFSANINFLYDSKLSIYNLNQNLSSSTNYNAYHFGILNSSFIQINATKRFNIGFEMAMGMNKFSFEKYENKYLDKVEINKYNDNKDYYTMFNYNFSIGYRF